MVGLKLEPYLQSILTKGSSPFDLCEAAVLTWRTQVIERWRTVRYADMDPQNHDKMKDGKH